MANITVKDILFCTEGKLLSGEESTVVENFSINSLTIKEGDIFVPIIGERTDGHKYIQSALEGGAVATLTSVDLTEDFVPGKAYILVEDTLKALQSIAEFMRSRMPLPIVGITGSVGKTTTKEMIAAVLETKRNTFKTEGNMNSQIGVSIMMTRLEAEHNAAVIEMGVSEFGEMDNLTRIAKPDFFVMTNIGVSHIGQFKTRDNICSEKLKIINGYKEDNSKTFAYDLKDINCLFVNGDDDKLVRIAEYSKALNDENASETDIAEKLDNCPMSEDSKKALDKTKVITYGIDGDYNYKAINIEINNGQTSFDAVYGDKKEHIVLNVLGKHNIYNALVAIAIGRCFDIEPSVAKEGLFNYRPIKMRGTIEEYKGVKVIDDTYNASPDSMRSGINVLLAVDNVEKRIAVLADIMELGEMSHDCHYEVGEYIVGKDIDEVVTIGENSMAIAEAIQDGNAKKTSKQSDSANKREIITHSFMTNEEAIEYLNKALIEGTVVLIKGSRGMHTDEIVEAIKNR